jgi:hypothetical protein
MEDRGSRRSRDRLRGRGGRCRAPTGLELENVPTPVTRLPRSSSAVSFGMVGAPDGRHAGRAWRLLAASGLAFVLTAPAGAVDGLDEYRRFMDPERFEQMSPQARATYAARMLDPVRADIVASAERNRVPPRLLAACLLNELIDYSLVDGAQQYIPNTGSVGIAQINVLTAIRHRLVDLTVDEIRREELRLAGASQVQLDPAERRRYAVERLTWQKLNQPAIAVEAAAREVSLILDRANRNLDRVWARALLRGPIDRRDPYALARTEEPLETDPVKVRIDKERSLALLVCAAYNTETILEADFPLDSPFRPVMDRRAPFYNARNHGVNAYDLVAGMLATAGWFADVDPVRPARLEPEGQQRLERRCARPGAADAPECRRAPAVDCDEYARNVPHGGDPSGFWRRFCEGMQQRRSR